MDQVTRLNSKPEKIWELTIKKGVSKVALFYGAFVPNPMHVYRVAGVLAGLGCTYGGASDMDAIVGQIFQIRQ